MEPARDGREDLASKPYGLAARAAAMEPARDGREDRHRRERPAPLGAAAMEPARDGREDGSQDSSRVSSADSRVCERFRAIGRLAFLCGVVTVHKRWLTCMRAVPGIRLTTGALARSDDDGTRHRKLVMMAEEQEP
jgi:hypothetical protein